jgi:hypothetical protein
MTTEAPPAPTPAAEPKPNSFARIIGALFSPNETFASVTRKPDWVMPLLVILVIGYISSAVIMPRMDWEGMANAQIEQMKARNPNMSQEQLDRVAKMGPAFGKVAGWIGPFLGVIWYLIVAGVLLLVFRLAGGEGNFAQAFSGTLYAWFPLVINGIVLTIVIFIRGSVNPIHMATLVKSNPAFLVDMKEKPVLYALLSSFDVFTIWTVVLLIIAFAALSRSSKAKSSAIVISAWTVCILVKLIGPALQSLRK